MTLKSQIIILLALIPFMGKSQENADHYVEKGHENFKNKEYREAIV